MSEPLPVRRYLFASGAPIIAASGGRHGSLRVPAGAAAMTRSPTPSRGANDEPETPPAAWARTCPLEVPMAMMAVAFPILPGKTADWRSFVAELKGARNAEYVASRARAHVREQTFLQSTPKWCCLSGDLINPCGRPLPSRRRPMPQTLLPARAGEHSPLDEMLMAFLAEKLRRSGIPADGRGLQPDALPALREARQDARPGHAARRPRLRPRHRALGPGPVVDHGRRPDRLPVQLLPVPDPDEPRHVQPLRRPGAPEERHGAGPRATRPRRSAGCWRSCPTPSAGGGTGRSC